MCCNPRLRHMPMLRTAALEGKRLIMTGAASGMGEAGPGPVASPMLESLRRASSEGAATVDQLLDSIPAGRFATPLEVAEAVLWLLSDASSFVTGIALPVDGGLTAR